MKRAIVVGATSGIGRQVALQLAQKGWLVGVAGRRRELLEELVNSSNNIVAYSQTDITQEDAPQSLERLITDLGGMDLYFHSSGIGWQNYTLNQQKELLTAQTNTMGFVRMVDYVYNRFVSNNGEGHIACITSIAGTKGLGAAPAYSATKRFQSHYLESLMQNARMRGLPVQITDIRPGFVATDLISGSSYPLQLPAENVARHIVKTVEKRQRVCIIDWRYSLLVFFWRLIPRWLWIRMKITTKD